MNVHGFDVLGKLGAGGYGTSYLARRETDGTEVVIKVFHPGTARVMDFDSLRESVDKLKSARSPYLVRPIEVLERDDVKALVSEYVEGVDLSMLLTDGPIPVAAAAELAGQLAAALRAGATFRLQHGDLKPANILITADGQAHLTDLGLYASNTAGQIDPDHTMFFASLGYMSPERLELRDAGASDVYALGGVLFHCVTGAAPGQTEVNPGRHETNRQLVLGKLRAVVSESELIALVGDCLAYDAQKRPSPAIIEQVCFKLSEGSALRSWASEAVPAMLGQRLGAKRLDSVEVELPKPPEPLPPEPVESSEPDRAVMIGSFVVILVLLLSVAAVGAWMAMS